MIKSGTYGSNLKMELNNPRSSRREEALYSLRPTIPNLIGASLRRLPRKKASASAVVSNGSETFPTDLTTTIVIILLLSSQFGCNRRSSEMATTQAESVARPPKIELIPLTNMVLIKAGTFLRIKYPVTISRDFWIGKYEVTQGEFTAVLGRNPSRFAGDSNRPVEKVTFLDASAYCLALTQREREAGRLSTGYEYRLPSEAEWEYACRAGTTNLF